MGGRESGEREGRRDRQTDRQGLIEKERIHVSEIERGREGG